MIQIIGWTILHSLWQIALIASLYLLIKNSLQTKMALKKYYLAISALVTTFLSTIFTFGYIFQQNNPFISIITNSALPPITSEVSSPILSIETNKIVVDNSLTLTDYLSSCLPYLVTFWVIGMLYFTIRFLKNLYDVQQLKNMDSELISGEWRQKISRFKNQLNIQKEVQVFLSKHVKDPITFGHFKPVILLPISLITGFDTAAIETIILHELAHIKRQDYLINLGLSIIEIILFYHPLVWWLCRETRELREHCCDDLVLSMGNNRSTYVETLTALQWRKLDGVTNHLSLSAKGQDSEFPRRIKRMFGVEEKRGSFRQLMGLFLVLLMVAVGGLFLKNYYSTSIKENQRDTTDNAQTIIYLNENTTDADLQALIKYMRKIGAFEDFTSCGNKYGNEWIYSVKGSYSSKNGAIIPFEFDDYKNKPVQFVFEDDFLIKAEYLKDDYSDNLIIIDRSTKKSDLINWSNKLKDKGIKFDFSKSTFDGKGLITELKGFYDGNGSSDEFHIKSPAHINVKFTLMGNKLNGPEFIYLNEVSKNSNMEIDTLIYFISNELTKIELYEIIDKIRKHSQIRIDLNPIKTKYDKSDKLTAISGKYIYERHNGIPIPIQTFEVANLSQFHIRFKAHPEATFAPAYYNIATKEFIQVADHYSALKAFAIDAILKGGPLTLNTSNNYEDINAILIINEYSNINDLKAFAEKILPNNIIFRYQDSEFRGDGTIAKLAGDFLGNSRISEPFYVDDLTKYQVKLRVDKGYIYQPEITQQQQISKRSKYDLPFEISREDSLYVDSLRLLNGIPTLSSIKSKKQLFYKPDNSLKREYEINLLQATKEKERIYWREKLKKLAKSQENFPPKPYFNFQPNFSQKTSNQTYKITNWELLGLDSTTIKEKQKYETYRNNSLAQLIPPYVVTDSVRVHNPIYRHGIDEAPKSIYINGQLTPKKDLPAFMQNQLQNAINTNIPATKKYPKTAPSVDWLYWGDQKINLGDAYKKDEDGKLIWDVSKLEISKEVWDRNKDRPFIFQVDGSWYRVKDIDMVLLVPHKQNPSSVTFNVGYEKALRISETNVFKLLAKAKEKDHIYFEKMDIGLEQLISMSIKIQEEYSTGFAPKSEKLIEQPQGSKTEFVEVLGRQEIDINSFKNWIQWGNRKFNFSATFQEGRDGKMKLQPPMLEITKNDWERLQSQSFTFYLDKEWYKVKTIKEIVHIPYKKDPKAVTLHQGYYQTIQDKNHRVTQLLATADVGDRLYFETIDVGKDFTFGMVVKIVDTPKDKSTGFLPEKAIQFDENDDLLAMDSFPAAFQNSRLPTLKIDAFAPKNIPENHLRWSRIPPKKNPIYIINGVKYKNGWPKDLPHRVIKSMNVQMGIKAKSLYGEDKVYIITTEGPILQKEAPPKLISVDEVLQSGNNNIPKEKKKN